MNRNKIHDRVSRVTSPLLLGLVKSSSLSTPLCRLKCLRFERWEGIVLTL